MAVFVLKDATVFTGGYDLSGDLNKVTGHAVRDDVDATTFGGGGARAHAAGLMQATIEHDGYLSYDAVAGRDPDTDIWATLGAQRVVTVTPAGADGDVAYVVNAMNLDYTPLSGSPTELAAFSGIYSSSDKYGLVRGRLLLPKQSISGNHNGTGVQLGAVSSTAKLYTAIHVFAAGTTADVIVESDDNSGFSSATTRSTTTVTDTGGTFVVPVAGAISDTYWRVRSANVTGTFSIAVAVGIQ